MTEHRIMYICTECADGYPEGCGHFDRNDLRAMPDGKWLCKQCFDDTSQIERGNDDEDKYLVWSDLSAPPAYAALRSEDGK